MARRGGNCELLGGRAQWLGVGLSRRMGERVESLELRILSGKMD